MEDSFKLEVSGKKTWKISINKKQFIKSFINLAPFSPLNLTNLLKDLFDAFELKKREERLAFELIFNSLSNAINRSIKSDKEILNKIDGFKKYNEEFYFFSEYYNKSLEIWNIEITEDFFHNPHKSKFLESFKPIFKNWLKEIIQKYNEEIEKTNKNN